MVTYCPQIVSCVCEAPGKCGLISSRPNRRSSAEATDRAIWSRRLVCCVEDRQPPHPSADATTGLRSGTPGNVAYIRYLKRRAVQARRARPLKSLLQDGDEPNQTDRCRPPSREGTIQRTNVLVRTAHEAAAAEEAGIAIINTEFDPKLFPAIRAAAPTPFIVSGVLYGTRATTDDHLRAAGDLYNLGVEAMYCVASIEVISRLAAEGFPIMSHVGLIPSKRTWTGGFRAVGKTAAGALEIWNQVRRLEEAGAVGAEIEVVPHQGGNGADIAVHGVDGIRVGLRRAVPLPRHDRVHRRRTRRSLPWRRARRRDRTVRVRRVPQPRGWMKAP